MSMKLSFELENFGGKTRTLLWDMNSLSTLEELLNKNLIAESDFWVNMGIRDFRAMIWSMLYKDEDAPSIEDVGDWISEYGFNEIGEKVAGLFSKVVSGTSSPNASDEAVEGTGDLMDPTKV